MKTFPSPFFPSTALRCAAAVAVFALALPEAAVAGNPLRSLKSKVKGGVNKVKRIVHPRRAVAALRHGAATTVEWINPGPIRPAHRPRNAGVSRGIEGYAPSWQHYGEPYYHRGDDDAEDGQSLRNRPYPLKEGSPFPAREREPQPPPRRYAEGEERSRMDLMEERQPHSHSRGLPEHTEKDSGQERGREREFHPKDWPETLEIPQHQAEERRVTEAAPSSPSAAVSAQPRPQPALATTASPSDPLRRTQTEEDTGETTPPRVSATAGLSPEKAGTREDLPYGQPVVGRPGLVYSPHARDSLVNVADIPSGTRVKCPYTKKHFRVP